MLLFQIGLAELIGHQVALLHANAMLARQHAAHLDAKPQDLGAERLRPLEFALFHDVEDDQRMQIAVAGVKHVAETEPVVLGQLGHLSSTCGRAWRGMVPSMQIMSGASRPIAGNAALRPAQMRDALLLVGGFDRGAAALRDDVGDARHRIGDIGFHAVGFDDQDGFGAGRIAGLVIVFHRFDAAPVHEFHRRGHDAVGDDGGHALARGRHGAERRPAGCG